MDNFWLKVAGLAAVGIAIAVGLIEWNARRQASVMTAEIFRPPTPEEEAQMKADIAASEAKWKQEEEEFLRNNPPVRTVQIGATPQRRNYHALPPGYKCTGGVLLYRLPNGWEQITDSSSHMYCPTNATSPAECYPVTPASVGCN